jgi:hypothetical protein
VPGQQRRGRDRKDLAPAPARYEPCQRSEPGPVSGLIPHPGDVTAQHRVLVAQNQQFSHPWTDHDGTARPAARARNGAIRQTRVKITRDDPRPNALTAAETPRSGSQPNIRAGQVQQAGHAVRVVEGGEALPGFGPGPRCAEHGGMFHFDEIDGDAGGSARPSLRERRDRRGDPRRHRALPGFGPRSMDPEGG